MPRLDKCVANFKSFTGKQIINHLKEYNVTTLLKRLSFSKRAHKKDRDYQFWQEGSHPEMIFNENIMREKLNYIHLNPVKRGYIDQSEQWRYSSAKNYAGQTGVIQIDAW